MNGMSDRWFTLCKQYKNYSVEIRNRIDDIYEPEREEIHKLYETGGRSARFDLYSNALEKAIWSVTGTGPEAVFGTSHEEYEEAMRAEELMEGLK